MDNSNKVYNPSSHRYVKKNSKLGKLILAGKIPPKKPAKACSDSQIRNPNSQRCIKKTGKIARSLNSSPMTSNGSFVASSSSSPLALPIVPGAYVPPAVVPQSQLITTSQAASILDKRKSDLIKMNKIIKEKKLNAINMQTAIRNDKAVNVLQKAFRNKLSKNRELDAARSIQNEKLKGLIDTSRNIVAQQNAQSKAMSTIGAAIKRRDAVKDYSTTKRKAATAKFYDSANRKIKETMPALIGAGVATGMGLAGVF